MTREEAKANLNMISVAFVEPVTKEQKKLIDDTFDVAIQSLTAISELSKSLKAVNRYEMDEKVLIGFNMAVAIFNKCFGESCALKNEQTDEDLISRQAVIDLLNKLIEVEQKQGTDVMNYGRERVNAYESILDEIESDYLFPSMSSAEKTAEWYDKKMTIKKAHGIAYGRWGCSSCKAKFPQKSNYCPNCGVKMKEREEEE